MARKRLFREARAAGTLDHPNICPVYEVGDQGDRAFIAMQYVEGETLHSRIKTNPPSLQQAIDIACLFTLFLHVERLLCMKLLPADTQDPCFDFIHAKIPRNTRCASMRQHS